MNPFLWVRDYLKWFSLLIYSGLLDLEAYIAPGLEAELRRLRRAILMAIGFPALLIIIGSALGAWSDTAKDYVIGIGLFLLVAQMLVLAWRRAIAGILLGLLFEVVVQGKKARSFREVGVDGVKNYIDVVMYILFTEITLGLLAMAFPVHESPKAALVVVITTIGLVAYGIWKGSKSPWPQFAKVILVLAMVYGLLALAFPKSTGVIVGRLGNFDPAAAEFARTGKAPAFPSIQFGTSGPQAEPDKDPIRYAIPLSAEGRDIINLQVPCWGWKMGHWDHSWPIYVQWWDGETTTDWLPMRRAGDVPIVRDADGRPKKLAPRMVKGEGTLYLFIFGRAECERTKVA